MKIKRWFDEHRSMRGAWRATAAAAVLGVGLTGCISPTESDPNTVPVASASQLFVASQPTIWFWWESDMSRFASVFMQQMDGTDRQFQDYAQYDLTEQDADGSWIQGYLQGGIIDIKKALAQTEESGDRIFSGILKIHLALLGGGIASVYGDAPFREAGVDGISTPVYDGQIQLYNDVIALLGEAIADLQSNQGPGPGAADIAFNGEIALWIPAAHSLAARYHMHLAELEGATRYQQALSEAQQGISSVTGNWTAIHSTTPGEQSVWNLFNIERAGYISAGDYLVETLKARDDARLPIYFSPGTDCPAGETYCGSPPGDEPSPGTGASQMNRPNDADFDFPIVSCTETQAIIAEASFALGDEAAAQAALDEMIQCQQAFWDVPIAAPTAALSGQPLLEEIILEKYIGMFLSNEVWQTYKRTCLPALPTYMGRPIPGRFLYTQDERLSNPNFPGNPQSGRNPNDPQGC